MGVLSDKPDSRDLLARNTSPLPSALRGLMAIRVRKSDSACGVIPHTLVRLNFTSPWQRDKCNTNDHNVDLITVVRT